VPSTRDKLSHLPEDSKSLQAIVKALLAEREEQKRHAEELRIENLRLQLELERYKKYYYGPRADRLGSSDDLAQMLLEFGAPFAGTGLLGLSKLSLGWMKLGIVHERIQAGRPQQNGRHERMHRTLKEDTMKPPAASLRAQQSRFDRFCHVFNYERPHEGLNNQTPASLYHSSSVRLPRKMPEFTYAKGLLLRRVNNSGDISWHKNRIFISEVFRFEELGFELVTPGFYRVFFRDMEIGELNAEELRFRAARRVI
jgi:hypothetical protein